MNTGMVAQVDESFRSRHRLDGPVQDRLRRADKRNDRSVMIDVDVPIQNDHSVLGFNSFGYPIERFGLAAFAEVWYTLNETIFDL
jgi:hypothetical protein